MKQLLPFFLFLPLIGFGQCKDLRKKTDKFTGAIRAYSTYAEPTTVIRVVDGEKTTYYLRLAAPAAANFKRKGVKVLLADGQRLEWPEQEVKVEFETFHPRWSTNLVAEAFITLTEEQVRQLARSRITDYQLYIYDWSLKEKLGEAFRQQFECLQVVDINIVKESR